MRRPRNFDPTRRQIARERIRRSASPYFPLLFFEHERGMGQRPFILQNVVIDLQCRERIWRAVTKRGTAFPFHSENASALHSARSAKTSVCGARSTIDNCGPTCLTARERMLA